MCRHDNSGGDNCDNSDVDESLVLKNKESGAPKILKSVSETDRLRLNEQAACTIYLRRNAFVRCSSENTEGVVKL